jgi:integrase
LELYGERDVGEIVPADVDTWLVELLSRGYQDATMAGYRQSVKALFNYAVNEELIPRSPAAHLRVGSFVPRMRKKPSLKAVAKAKLVATTWLQENDPCRLRDGLIFLISCISGPRLGEIRNLRKRDVEHALDEGPDEFGVYRVPTKGKTGEAIIHFNETVAFGFRRWLAARPSCQIDALFVALRPSTTAVDKKRAIRPLSRSGITSAYDRVSEAAGLSRPIRSHALRHYVGDEATRRHGPKVAAMLLNHADAATAQTAITFYHHPDQDDVSRAVVNLSQPPEEELHAMLKLFGLE